MNSTQPLTVEIYDNIERFTINLDSRTLVVNHQDPILLSRTSAHVLGFTMKRAGEFVYLEEELGRKPDSTNIRAPFTAHEQTKQTTDSLPFTQLDDDTVIPLLTLGLVREPKRHPQGRIVAAGLLAVRFNVDYTSIPPEYELIAPYDKSRIK